jgi:hypothetical protein
LVAIVVLLKVGLLVMGESSPVEPDFFIFDAEKAGLEFDRDIFDACGVWVEERPTPDDLEGDLLIISQSFFLLDFLLFRFELMQISVIKG